MNGFPESADRRAVRRATTTRCSSSPRSSRPASTSRCCTRCTWTRCSPASTPSRPSPGSTASHPRKDDTFVLDFRNEADDIVKAFEPYYGETVALPTDPNLLYDTRQRLDDFDVLRADEIEAAVAVLLAMTGAKDHGQVYAAPGPGVERFKALGRGRPGRRSRTPWTSSSAPTRFLSQVVASATPSWSATTSTAGRSPHALRDAATPNGIDLGSEVELTHLRD